MKFILLFTLISSAAWAHDKTEYDIETFCQDLNVILIKVQTHSMNIENHQTTRTSEGGPYKRRIITKCHKGHCEMHEDRKSPILHYKPDHPDADENGYVAYPNFSVQEELKGLIKAQNAYDLVVGNMPVENIHLLAGDKFKHCHENYAFFKEQFDFQSYLGR